MRNKVIVKTRTVIKQTCPRAACNLEATRPEQRRVSNPMSLNRYIEELKARITTDDHVFHCTHCGCDYKSVGISGLEVILREELQR